MAYELLISDWGSDVCPVDLPFGDQHRSGTFAAAGHDPKFAAIAVAVALDGLEAEGAGVQPAPQSPCRRRPQPRLLGAARRMRFRRVDVGNAIFLPGEPEGVAIDDAIRSEEHTSELQSLMRISYAVFCLKKKNNIPSKTITNN